MQRQGSNSVQIRSYNERVILDTVRKLEQASKAEIARLSNLTPQAVSGIVDSLGDAGYIELVGKRIGSIGQPSTLYAIKANCGYSIGLHIGRRHFDAVLVDFAGKDIQSFTRTYDYPTTTEVARLALEGTLLLQRQLPRKVRDRIIGIGVSIPNFLGGGWHKDLRFPVDILLEWKTFNLPLFLSEKTKLSVLYENDGLTATIAELNDRNTVERNFLYLYISTFVGGGVVLNGYLERGSGNRSATFNTIPVSLSALSTVDKPRAPFELLRRRASVFVLLNHLRANGVVIGRLNEIFAMGNDLQPFLSEWQEDCANALAEAIVGAVSMLNIDSVIIDSILPRSILEEIIRLLKRQYEQIAPTSLTAGPTIRVGSIGANASALGAAILPLHTLLAPNSDMLSGSNSPRRLSTFKR